jgi:hypothetical protein
VTVPPAVGAAARETGSPPGLAGAKSILTRI